MAIETRMLGRVDYAATVQSMQDYTATRTPDSPDLLLICEHPPLYHKGWQAKRSHPEPGEIPVIATNRGGQVTFHGPGQVVAYPLIDLQRAGYYVKEYVYRVEEAVIRTLDHFGVTGHPRRGRAWHLRAAGRSPQPRPAAAAPPKREGTAAPEPDFTGLGKIAALGIKVSRHCTYHGVALNVDMDLEPYRRINPCGYAGLQTVDLSTIGVSTTWEKPRRCWANSSACAWRPDSPPPHAMSLLKFVNRKYQPHSPNRRLRPNCRAFRSKVEQGEVLKARLDPREPGSPPRASAKSRKSCASTSCTVCKKASCPTLADALGKGTAAFMIMGDNYAPLCPFCDVDRWPPRPLDKANTEFNACRAQAQVCGDHQRGPRRPARGGSSR